MLSRMIARFVTIVLLMIALGMHAQMSLVISSVPQLTPLRDTLYVAGSFNGWNPRDENYRMESGPNGYSVLIQGTNGSSYSYKITRGSWPTVEGSSTGGFIADRSLIFQNGSSLSIEVAGWEDIAGNPTVTPNVRILDSNFHIPQLQRNRRIWISFPPDYFISSD